MRKTEDKVNDVRETVAGALVGAGVAITLTRIHIPSGPTVETNTATQESDATQQQVAP